MTEFVSDPFWKEEVRRAREQTAEEKLRLGGDLFDAACAVTLSGIRVQYPSISDAEALDILRKRLDLSRRIEGRI